MKILLLGCVIFTLYMCLSDAKEVRQISSLVPLDDWIDFKNRTKDVKPIDKFIGKLRATYDFVFHKADNVSNVGKILGKAAEEDKGENIAKINLTDSFVGEKNTSELADDEVPIDEKSMKVKLDEGFTQSLKKLEEALPLDRLEIIDDEDSVDSFSFDEETEQLDSTIEPAHSKFHLPYAIAQALLRWLISLYYSTSQVPAQSNPADKEGV